MTEAVVAQASTYAEGGKAYKTYWGRGVPVIALKIAVLVSLQGCGLFGRGPASPPCPPVAIVGETGKLVKFRPGPGRDLIDVLFEAEISNFRGSCAYDKAGVSIDMVIEITMQRGPADRSGSAAFEYFVAIPKLRPQPAAKRQFPVSAEFQSNITRGLYRDEITMRIPLAELDDGPDHQIYLGFQLLPDELEFNRRRRLR